mgnify:FL=1
MIFQLTSVVLEQFVNEQTLWKIRVQVTATARQAAVNVLQYHFAHTKVTEPWCHHTSL